MEHFFEKYQSEIIYSLILFAIFIVANILIRITLRRIANRGNIKEARVNLINRYITVTLFLVVILIESFIFGAEAKDLALVFSSVFAVIGIGLFAIWSILSHITSGLIMFFAFPYKVGDKIKIHDNDFPEEATIEDIRAFHLHLRLDNGNLVTYPNNLMLQKPVTLIEKDLKDEGVDAV